VLVIGCLLSARWDPCSSCRLSWRTQSKPSRLSLTKQLLAWPSFVKNGRSLTALPDVLGSVADLRDLFIQSIVFGADPSPSQQSTVLLPFGRWETFKGWVVDHTRLIVSRPGQPCTGEAGVDSTGTTVHFGSRTTWLDVPVARMAYDIVWMVKRLVGGAGGAVPGRLLSFRSGCVLPQQDVPVPDPSFFVLVMSVQAIP